jgi:hypothetical protein
MPKPVRAFGRERFVFRILAETSDAPSRLAKRFGNSNDTDLALATYSRMSVWNLFNASNVVATKRMLALFAICASPSAKTRALIVAGLFEAEIVRRGPLQRTRGMLRSVG